MTNQVITIGRQYGSGGREIGKKLAERLGIPFYDKELITIAAKKSGMSEKVFASIDEKASSSLLYSLFISSFPSGANAGTLNEMPLNDKLFLLQFETIKQLAEHGPCVIVGRCADYMLREYERAFSVFIHAPLDVRVKRIMRIENLDEKRATDLVNKTDKRRASYYNYFTSRKWSDMESYHLTINSNDVGIDGTVDMIEYYIKLRESKQAAKK